MVWRSGITFPEDDWADGGVGVDRLLLHGREGAALGNPLHLLLCQAVAKEAADVTDAGCQILSVSEEEKEVQTESVR